jgi:hypothetical protein
LRIQIQQYKAERGKRCPHDYFFVRFAFGSSNERGNFPSGVSTLAAETRQLPNPSSASRAELGHHRGCPLSFQIPIHNNHHARSEKYGKQQ